jgi:hypothetical protein
VSNPCVCHNEAGLWLNEYLTPPRLGKRRTARRGVQTGNAFAHLCVVVARVPPPPRRRATPEQHRSPPTPDTSSDTPVALCVPQRGGFVVKRVPFPGPTRKTAHSASRVEQVSLSHTCARWLHVCHHRPAD